MPKGVKIIEYAVDLAVVVVARKKMDLKRKANESVIVVRKWIDANILAKVPKKKH